ASVPPSTPAPQARGESWDPRSNARTVEQAVYGAATVPTSARPDLLADGPTMQSTPPPALAGAAQAAAVTVTVAVATPAPPKSRARLYVAAAVVIVASTAVGAYLLGAEQTQESLAGAPSATTTAHAGALAPSTRRP